MKQTIVLMLTITQVFWILSAILTSLGFLPDLRQRGLGKAGTAMLAGGAGMLAALVALLWIELDRPPMRTLGETRLWYALLLAVIGLIVQWRFKLRILQLPLTLFGILFVSLNLAYPETLDRTLMPALQSPWFVPHVVVYMVAYAALTEAALAAVVGLARSLITGQEPVEEARIAAIQVHIGLPLLTFGLVFGALWAKEAWGHYWMWDPKETWAFISWAIYLGVIHMQRDRAASPRSALALGVGAFAAILACWFLVNYLPAATVSVHTYTN